MVLSKEIDVQKETAWEPADLIKYFIINSYNTESVDMAPPVISFPDSISPGKDLQTVFREMRQKTKRLRREQLTYIGVNSSRDKVHTPHEFLSANKAISKYVGAFGFTSYVNPELFEQLTRRGEAMGIKYHVADIHSHYPPTFILGLLFDTDDFSLGDVYSLIENKSRPPASFLVGPNTNSALFRTNETKFLPPETTLDNFLKQYFGEHFERAFFLEPKFLIRDAAKKYGLVLYKGKPEEKLKKLFTPQYNYVT